MSEIGIFRQSSSRRYNDAVTNCQATLLFLLLVSSALMEAQEVRVVDLLHVN